jgi:hypothetical protein
VDPDPLTRPQAVRLDVHALGLEVQAEHLAQMIGESFQSCRITQAGQWAGSKRLGIVTGVLAVERALLQFPLGLVFEPRPYPFAIDSIKKIVHDEMREGLARQVDRSQPIEQACPAWTGRHGTGVAGMGS